MSSSIQLDQTIYITAIKSDGNIIEPRIIILA
jgi:hypothetical protein